MDLEKYLIATEATIFGREIQIKNLKVTSAIKNIFQKILSIFKYKKEAPAQEGVLDFIKVNNHQKEQDAAMEWLTKNAEALYRKNDYANGHQYYISATDKSIENNTLREMLAGMKQNVAWQQEIPLMTHVVTNSNTKQQAMVASMRQDWNSNKVVLLGAPVFEFENMTMNQLASKVKSGERVSIDLKFLIDVKWSVDGSSGLVPVLGGTLKLG